MKKRMGVFAELATMSQRPFGRTALMKLCYFLQESKDVPLEYNFSLYTYGPFDSEVLSDLQTAEELQILDLEFEQYSGGYGYQIRAGSAAERAKNQADVRNFLDKYKTEIDWAANLLAPKRPAELELTSIIVFISKERGNVPESTLVSLVRAVKPRFSASEVTNQIQWLKDNGLVEFD